MAIKYQIIMYTGFILWFIAGIAVGKYRERKRQFREKIKRQLNRTRKDWYVEVTPSSSQNSQ
jgi:uncharacterized membrane protein